MKKFSLILSVFLIPFLLFGCSQKDVDLTAVLSEINSTYTLCDVTQIKSTDELNKYYQTDTADIKQFACEISTNSTDLFELIIIEAVSIDSAKNIATRLNNHYQSLLSTSLSYSPETADLLSNSSVKTTGCYVYLVISENSDDIVNVIEKYL